MLCSSFNLKGFRSLGEVLESVPSKAMDSGWHWNEYDQDGSRKGHWDWRNAFDSIFQLVPCSKPKDDHKTEWEQTSSDVFDKTQYGTKRILQELLFDAVCLLLLACIPSIPSILVLRHAVKFCQAERKKCWSGTNGQYSDCIRSRTNVAIFERATQAATLCTILQMILTVVGWINKCWYYIM